MMRLRHQTFHTFKELNLAIRELMNELNQRYLYTETKRAKVGPDYHIEYRSQYYSVPHQLVGHHVELEASNRLVQIFHQDNLVAQHPSSQRERGNSTQPEHLLGWGANIGPATREVVNKILNSKPHPEQSYRSCLGLLSLSKTYGESRLEQACKDALMLTKSNYTFISNLLKNNREGQLSKDNTSTPNLVHSNVRGPNSYH